MEKGTLYAFKDKTSGQMLVGTYSGEDTHGNHVFKDSQPIEHLYHMDLPSVESGLAKPPYWAQGGCV